jgi:hypothetical protein
VLDKTTSYKFVGGKLVARTAEELTRLKQLKAEQAKCAKGRMPRSTERFAIVTLSQAEKLIMLEHVCWPLFTILLFENFRQRGQPFILPTRQLNTVQGLRPTNLRQALIQLETCGLISITRNPPKPPLIAVL